MTTSTAEVTSTTEDDLPEPTTTTERDDDADAYADGLALGLTLGDEDDGEFVLSPDEAECVAPEWIDIIGVDTLNDAGVSPADLEDPDYQFSDLGLDADTGGDLIDVFGDCDLDIIGEFRTILGADLDDEQAACLADELDDELARQFLIEALVQIDLSVELDDELARIDSVCQLS